MIYDCFPFWNEMEMLSLRFYHLAPLVDKFVIVESKYDFQGNSKPLVFLENKHRWPENKFIHIIAADLMANQPNQFYNEKRQRNVILGGLSDAKPEDIIMIGDIDEFPGRREVNNSYTEPTTFMQDYYKYGSDLRVHRIVGNQPEDWPGTVILPFKDLTTPQDIRDDRWKFPKVKSGWHLSWFGGMPMIIGKTKATSHITLNNPENQRPDRLIDMIKHGEDPLDSDKCLVKVEPPFELRDYTWSQKYPSSFPLGAEPQN